MSLFNKLNINLMDKNKILDFIDTPTLTKWNAIYQIRLKPTNYALWQAVNLIKPQYVFEYSEVKGWKSFPDAILLTRAIKNAIVAYKQVKEDNDFFFGGRGI